MSIKQAECRTLLVLLRFALAALALLGSWGFQPLADSLFQITHNVGNMVREMVGEQVENAAPDAATVCPLYYRMVAEDGSTYYYYTQYYYTYDGELVGLSDALGNVVAPARYRDIVALPATFLVRDDSGWRFLSLDFQPLSDDVWDTAELQTDERGFIARDVVKVAQNGRYGATDLTGAIRIAPLYDAFDPYPLDSDWDIIRVRQDGSYGYINSAGEIVVPLLYDYALNSTLLVYEDEEDTEGHEIPVIYVMRGDDWGLIEKTADGGAGAVDWTQEPPAEVVAAWQTESGGE